jgi:hypothetical protein
MGRQRREQWTAIDEDGVILSNFIGDTYSAFFDSALPSMAID